MTDDEYLFYILSDPEYTNKFKIDLSGYKSVFKNAIRSKLHPIIHRDLIVGNFVGHIQGGYFILFKVIHTSEEFFIISDDGKEETVVYDGYNKGVCENLNITFSYKMSALDLNSVINSIKENVNEYHKVVDTVKKILHSN